jgi:hypothetical protein
VGSWEANEIVDINSRGRIDDTTYEPVRLTRLAIAKISTFIACGEDVAWPIPEYALHSLVEGKVPLRDGDFCRNL